MASQQRQRSSSSGKWVSATMISLVSSPVLVDAILVGSPGTEDYAFAVECLGLCNFYQHALNIKVGRLAEIYSAATGMPMDGEGRLKAAARGLDIRKAFNQREGVSRKDDTMPMRFLTESLMVRGQMRHPTRNKNWTKW